MAHRNRTAFGATARAVLAGVALVAGGATIARADTIAFFEDFEDGLPVQLSAPGATIEPVQGFEDLGTPGNRFAGNVLRYSDPEVLETQLVVTGLPPHDTLSVGFLLGVIDSWDGVEVLEVLVDGEVAWSSTFDLAYDDVASYEPPPGGLLGSGTNLGWNAGAFYDNDRAYDLSIEPSLSDIPHTADAVVVTWRLLAVAGQYSPNWQGGMDESWAIDNVMITVSESAPSTTTSITITTSSTTTSSSSTTSHSSTTSTSATTTTLPDAGCAGVPDGPTFQSVRCRFEASLARVQVEHGLGSLRPKLATLLANGLSRATQARDVCAAGDTAKTKTRLRQAERTLTLYASRLNGGTARRKVDEALRSALVAPARALRADTKTLRTRVECPHDAQQ
jgi:hypothetical protein